MEVIANEIGISWDETLQVHDIVSLVRALDALNLSRPSNFNTVAV